MDETDWDDFLELCLKAKTSRRYQELFDLFLTLEEKENIKARYKIVKALLGGKVSQRELAQKYEVSISQITRGSNALKIIDPKFKRFLEEEMNV
jgi:TrpR family trp operon transcriptional repressor